MKKFFEKEISGLKAWWLLLPLGIGLVFFIVGSFLDLRISQTIADQHSVFGIFFEGWGMAIPFAVGSMAGASLAGGLVQLNKKVWKTLGFLMLAVAIIVMGYETGHYILKWFGGGAWLQHMGTGGKILGYVIGGTLMAGVGVPCFFLFKKYDAEKAIRLGLVVILWIGLEAGILEIIKRACYRPRWRYLFGYMYDSEGIPVYSGLDDPARFFRAWYRDWQWFSKSGYPDLVDSDAIKSFPSGHTGMGSVVLAVPAFLPLFGLKEEKLKLWQPIAFGLGLVFLLLLAFARVQVGAHWTTDVSFAMLFVSCLAICLILINDRVKIAQKPVPQAE